MIAPTHEKSMWSLGGLWGQVFGVIFGVRLRLLKSYWGQASLIVVIVLWIYSW